MSKQLLGQVTESGVFFRQGAVLQLQFVDFLLLTSDFTFELRDVFCLS